MLVFLDADQPQVEADPSLTQVARIPAEVGRIEFKAFDACPDPALYGELLSLLTGLVLDRTLPGRRTTPDAAAHRHVARRGLGDDAVHARTGELLDAAATALGGRDGRPGPAGGAARALGAAGVPGCRDAGRVPRGAGRGRPAPAPVSA